MIDVGAHIGTYAVPIAQTVGSPGRVLAIEPVEEHYVLLERNLERNHLTDRVLTFHALAGGEAKFHLGAQAGNSGSARFAGKGGARNVQFPGVRVDDIAPSGVALMKVDVEGMEADVLRSARQLLHRDRPIVIFETGTGSDIREVTSESTGLDYSFLVNLHQPSGHEDVFEPGRLSLEQSEPRLPACPPSPTARRRGNPERFERLAGFSPIDLAGELFACCPKSTPLLGKAPAVRSLSARHQLPEGGLATHRSAVASHDRQSK